MKQERSDDDVEHMGHQHHTPDVKLIKETEVDNASKSRKEFSEAGKPMPGNMDSQRHRGDADHPAAHPDLTDMYCDPRELDKLFAEFLNEFLDGHGKVRNFIVSLQILSFVPKQRQHHRDSFYRSSSQPVFDSNGRKAEMSGQVDVESPACTGFTL